MDADSSAIHSAEIDATLGVYRLVRSAARCLYSVRLAECALVGVSVGGVTFAAGMFSGASATSHDLRFAAVLGAIFGASAWWLERKPDIAEVARRIDRREGWSGELVTAFELGRPDVSLPAPNEIESLLGRRVGSELSLSRALRAVAPSSIALLGLPFASAAVLLFAIDSTGGGTEDAMAGIEAAIGSLASASSSLQSAAARADAAGSNAPGSISAESASLRALAQQTDRVRRDLVSRSLAARAAEDELGEPSARLHALTSRLRADPALASNPELAESLEQAERALEAARADLARGRDAGPDTDLDATARSMDGSRSGDLAQGPDSRNSGSTSPSASGAPDDRSRASTSLRDRSLPSGNPQGDRATSGAGSPTKSDPSASNAGAAMNGASSTPDGRLPTEERGSNGGRWWSQRYDAVVERWVESLREDRGDRPPGR